MSVKSEAETVESEKGHWEQYVRSQNPTFDRGGIRRTFAAGFNAGRHSKGAKPPAPQPAPARNAKRDENSRRRVKILNRRLQSIKRLHTQNADGFCDECELASPCLTLEIIEGKHRPTEDAGK